MADSGRMAPHSVEAEEAVPGSVLIDPPIIEGLLFLRSEDFFIVKNGWVWDALRTLHERRQPIDFVTVCNELEARGQLAEIGGAAFISHLMNVVPTALHAAGYARIVAEKAARRGLIQTASDLAQLAFDESGTPDLMSQAQERFFKFSRNGHGGNLKNRFRVHTAAEALAPQPPIDWLIEGVCTIPGLGVLVGEGGAGKTYAAIDQGVAIAKPELHWLNFRVHGGPVVFVDEESGERRLARREGEVLRGHDAGVDTPMGSVSLAGLNMRKSDDVERFRRVVLDWRARAVYLDCWADVMGGGDENDVADVQPIAHDLRCIADEAGCFIWLIHHTNRLGMYRGSTALKAACDLMLLFTREKGSNRVTFESVKARDTDELKFSAVMNFGEGTFCLSPAQVQANEHLTKAEEYVLRYLQEHPNAQMDAITGSADTCAPGSARNATYRLVQRGKVRRTDGGGSGSRATFGLSEAGGTSNP